MSAAEVAAAERELAAVIRRIREWALVCPIALTDASPRVVFSFVANALEARDHHTSTTALADERAVERRVDVLEVLLDEYPKRLTTAELLDLVVGPDLAVAVELEELEDDLAALEAVGLVELLDGGWVRHADLDELVVDAGLRVLAAGTVHEDGAR